MNASFPLHVSSPTCSSGDRGLEFGLEQASRIHTTIAGYRWMLRAKCGLHDADLIRLGGDIGARLRLSHPEIADEITGIAEGAGVDPALLMAINARTEILGLSTRNECSTLGVVNAVSGKGRIQRPLLAQNWDWHPVARGAVVVWVVPLDNQRWFVSVTEAGLIGKMGMNSSGLACCMNILHSPADGGLTGVPIHVLLREVLASCSSVDQARSRLESAEVGASTCITIASAHGELAGVELSPAGAAEVIPGANGRYVHTNHFLRNAERQASRDITDSATRLAELRCRLDEIPSPVTSQHIEALLRSHANQPASICKHPRPDAASIDFTETLASVIFDLAEGQAWACIGSPCTSDYELISLPHEPLPDGSSSCLRS